MSVSRLHIYYYLRSMYVKCTEVYSTGMVTSLNVPGMTQHKTHARKTKCMHGCERKIYFIYFYFRAVYERCCFFFFFLSFCVPRPPLLRSDTMEGYLECMQVPPEGIEAQVSDGGRGVSLRTYWYDILRMHEYRFCFVFLWGISSTPYYSILKLVPCAVTTDYFGRP